MNERVTTELGAVVDVVASQSKGGEDIFLDVDDECQGVQSHALAEDKDSETDLTPRLSDLAAIAISINQRYRADSAGASGNASADDDDEEGEPFEGVQPNTPSTPLSAAKRLALWTARSTALDGAATGPCTVLDDSVNDELSPASGLVDSLRRLSRRESDSETASDLIASRRLSRSESRRISIESLLAVVQQGGEI